MPISYFAHTKSLLTRAFGATLGPVSLCLLLSLAWLGPRRETVARVDEMVHYHVTVHWYGYDMGTCTTRTPRRKPSVLGVSAPRLGGTRTRGLEVGECWGSRCGAAFEAPGEDGCTVSICRSGTLMGPRQEMFLAYRVVLKTVCVASPKVCFSSYLSS